VALSYHDGATINTACALLHQSHKLPPGFWRTSMKLISQMGRSILQKYDTVALIALIILTLALRPVENRDSTLYLTRTMDFVDKLKERPSDFSIKDFGNVSTVGRPPLFQLLSIPFFLIFGYRVDSFLYVNLLFYILLAISTYNIGKIAKDSRVGILATILVVTYPPVVQLSRVMLTNFAVIGCTALTIWLLLRFVKTQSIKDAWLTILSIAFGSLVHPSFFWGVPIPVALILLYEVFFGSVPEKISRPKELYSWFFKRLRQPLFLYGILPSGLVSIALILMWYVPFGMPLLDVTKNVSLRASEWGGGKFILGPVFENLRYLTPLWYARTFNIAISTVLALLFGVSLVAVIVTRRLMGLYLGFIFIISYITNTLPPTFSWRYFSQILPLVAVLTALWIFSVRNKNVSGLLAILCVAASLFNYVMVSWGGIKIGEPVIEVLGILDDHRYCRPSFGFFCSDPPQPVIWPIDELVGTIVNDPQCKSGGCDIFIVSTSAYLVQGMNYSASVNFREKPVTMHLLLGTSEIEVGKLSYDYDLPALLESEYILIKTNMVSQVEVMTDTLFQSPPRMFSASHQIIAEFNVPDGSKVTLYKRVVPLTFEEAEETIVAFEIPEKWKNRKYQVYIHIAEKEGDTDRVVSLYQEALSQVNVPALRVEYLQGLADIYLKLGKTNDAKVNYQEVLDLQSDNYSAHAALLSIFKQEGNCENAISHAIMLTELKPNTKLYIDLGDLYRTCNNPDQAIVAYQDALRLDKENPFALLGLAQAYDSQGRIEEARDMYEKVIKYAPGSKYAIQAQRWLDAHK
jgi:hypothetical protein